jgi:hypothetical protein
MHSEFVHTFATGRNFVMDVIPSNGAPLVYATQTGQRRIALIGRPAVVPPSLLYISPDHSLTVSAIDPTDHDPADPALDPVDPTATAPAVTPVDRKESVMLRYQSPLSKKISKIYSTNSLSSVIARLGAMPDIVRNPRPSQPFIGASYEQIIEMVGSLAKDDLLNAKFVLQAPPPPILSTAEVLAGGRPDRNPESVTAPVVPATSTAPSAEAAEDARKAEEARRAMQTSVKQ